jgi:hypothetical protein
VALLRTTLLTLLAGAGAEEVDYPIGTLRAPPMTEAGDPFRLVDLRYSFTDDGRTLSSFETRIRLGGSAFLGGEVIGDRRGLFLDTQRLGVGVTEENGAYEVEASYRAPWFLLGARGLRADGSWQGATDGSLRLSNDWEVLFSLREDFDESRFVPGTIEEFATSGALPEPAPPERELSSQSVGLFYQRASWLELLGEARWSRRRTEASFDQDVDRYRLAGLLVRAPLSLDATFLSERVSRPAARRDHLAEVGAEIEIGGHFLARAWTRQRWEPGVLRFEERYRAELTFLGRRHRFARSSEAAPRIEALQKRVNALGYNERRVYDVDGLRRMRERLGISSRRSELAEDLDELYRAQVRDRNLPQLGVSVELADDAVRGVESRLVRVFGGVPWRLRWPFSRSEESVEFLSLELGIREDDYRAGVRAVSYRFLVTAFLNREMALRLGFERPGVTPEEIAREASSPDRFIVSYEYAFGR